MKVRIADGGIRAIGNQLGRQLEPADGRKLVDLPQQGLQADPSRIGLQLRQQPLTRQPNGLLVDERLEPPTHREPSRSTVCAQNRCSNLARANPTIRSIRPGVKGAKTSDRA
jgi:hypothetical protein